MKTTIELKNMCFFAYHGVLAQEKIVGTKYIVNAKIDVDITKSFDTDDVTDTINYADVYDLIKEEMLIASNLIEHVAGRIFRKIELKYPQINNLEIRLLKQNPPVNGEVEAAEIVVKS